MRWMVPLSLLLVCLLPAWSFAQANPPTHTHDPYAVHENSDHEAVEKEMAKKANLERQAQLRRDTERLYQLSTQLKQYVDKSSANTLSVDVIRKADEIEKLAHSVKEKMKGN